MQRLKNAKWVLLLLALFCVQTTVYAQEDFDEFGNPIENKEPEEPPVYRSAHTLTVQIVAEELLPLFRIPFPGFQIEYLIKDWLGVHVRRSRWSETHTAGIGLRTYLVNGLFAPYATLGVTGYFGGLDGVIRCDAWAPEFGAGFDFTMPMGARAFLEYTSLILIRGEVVTQLDKAVLGVGWRFQL